MRFERARLWPVLGAVGVAGVLTGCTSSPEPEFTQPSAPSAPAASGAPAAGGPAPAWSEPVSYSYVLTRGCDPAAPLGRYQATVQGGRVTGYSRIGAPTAAPSASADVELGPITGDEGEEIEVPSLRDLLAMARTTADDGGQATTEFDPADGHLVKVTINVTDDPNAAECWSVSDYRIG
ncbi:hypothetical protein [Actinoplanes teichomyceticus]|uniref:Lipoprotein n=1 Tax=Actinoplanes teichomyceticus TaxID=1867 RepID=A0A561WJG0_ACTTI|nr:hypothetical protein [Actinoplanes teichomyceticus]TWG24019.1 hypothetical protein FHX34_102572 [Actinoplanes teichomyceticus]GIF12061.1 hypothetical protein Ate01nite_20930 [Actinoplanes teichomyceticus]